MSKTISEYMTPCPHSVGAEQPLQTAIEAMRAHKVRHLPVLHGGQLVGMLSDRDIVLLESLGQDLRDKLKVEEAMSGEPFAVTKEAPLKDVLRKMADEHIGSAVVIEGNQVIGIYTSSDAVKMLAGVI